MLNTISSKVKTTMLSAVLQKQVKHLQLTNKAVGQLYKTCKGLLVDEVRRVLLCVLCSAL